MLFVLLLVVIGVVGYWTLTPRAAVAEPRVLVRLGDSNTSRGWDDQDRWCEYVAPMLLP